MGSGAVGSPRNQPAHPGRPTKLQPARLPLGLLQDLPPVCNAKGVRLRPDIRYDIVLQIGDTIRGIVSDELSERPRFGKDFITNRDGNFHAIRMTNAHDHCQHDLGSADVMIDLMAVLRCEATVRETLLSH